MAALFPTAVLEGVFRQDLTARPLSIAIAAGLTLVLPWRRSHPLLMVAIAFGVCGLSPFLVWEQFPNQNVMVYMVLLPFALFRWGSGREMVLGAAIMAVKLGLDATFGFLTLGSAVGGVVIISAAMAVGAAVRYRVRARTRELDQVKLLERERLARDLHDTVAHHVSAMAIRAQAGIATAGTDPNAAVDALRIIDAEAGRALDEMRGVVRILRTDAELAPGKRIADLTELVSRTGPAVEVEVVGEADEVPSPIGAAIYRLAQEAVTNARRHARNATRIDVRVVVDEKSVHLCVTDDGLLRQPKSTGFGLTGMIERASLLGGTCSAGPNTDRGWTVTAVLPRTGAAT